MRYERKREEGTAVFYEVLEQGRKAAEFFYAVKPCQTGRGNCQFWIERIHMEQDYLDYSYLDAVLQFIQYKCWCSGCTPFPASRMPSAFLLVITYKYERHLISDIFDLPHTNLRSILEVLLLFHTFPVL